MCNSQNNSFDQCDFGLDPMTLILKFDLDMVKIYLHTTKNEVSMLRHENPDHAGGNQCLTKRIFPRTGLSHSDNFLKRYAELVLTGSQWYHKRVELCSHCKYTSLCVIERLDFTNTERSTPKAITITPLSYSKESKSPMLLLDVKAQSHFDHPFR